MFPIKFEKLLEYLIQIKKTKILFISCISFEPRCLKAVKLLKKRLLGMEISWAFFHIIDNGSQYQDECSEKQLEHKNDIRRMLNLDVEVPEILLFNSKSRPEEELITYCNEILENNNEIQVVICDITTIPKKIYFPFLKWLIEEGNEKEDLIVCYSKPQEYNTEYLESEPQIPEKLIGMFNRKKDIIWIPTLGFKSSKRI